MPVHRLHADHCRALDAARPLRAPLVHVDLGDKLSASVERDPNALAIVDGPVRLTYAQWSRKISALIAGFHGLGLDPPVIGGFDRMASSRQLASVRSSLSARLWIVRCFRGGTIGFDHGSDSYWDPRSVNKFARGRSRVRDAE